MHTCLLVIGSCDCWCWLLVNCVVFVADCEAVVVSSRTHA